MTVLAEVGGEERVHPYKMKGWNLNITPLEIRTIILKKHLHDFGFHVPRKGTAAKKSAL